MKRRTSLSNRLRAMVFNNVLLKMVSLIIAFMLWSFLMLERKSEVTLNIPIRIENVPDNLVIVEPPPPDIRVAVRGSRTQLRSINEALMPYRIDLAGFRAGETTIDVIPDKINLPRGLRIVHVNPTKITIELAPVVRKRLPVAVRFRGELPKGMRLVGYQVQPEEIVVDGAQSELAAVEFVETEPINLSSVGGNARIEADLALGNLHIVDITTHTVEVTLQVAEVDISRTLKDVPVQLPAGFTSRGKATATVTVTGPAHAINELQASEVRLTVAPPRRGRARVEIRAEVPPHVIVNRIVPNVLELQPQ